MSSSTDETRESRFFLGDRPCVWHKAEGQVSAFDGYQKIEQRILIIKEDATGDVLRTLALFPAPMQSCPATPFEVDSVQRSGYQPTGF